MHILLSGSQIDEKWAYPILKKYIPKDSRVLILPFGLEGNQQSDWDSYYSEHRGMEYFEHINCFKRYGIAPKQIVWANYFIDSKEALCEKIKQSDVLFFCGGQPDLMMKRFKEYRIKKELKRFKGVVLGYSAGAMIQLDSFHLASKNGIHSYSGLSYLSGFDIEVHYSKKDRHQNQMIQSMIEKEKKTIYGIGNQGGLIVNQERIECFGDVTIFESKD